MVNWMIGGVDVSRLISGGYFANLLIKYYQHLSRTEGMSIDPFTNIVKVYTRDLTTNTINCH